MRRTCTRDSYRMSRGQRSSIIILLQDAMTYFVFKDVHNIEQRVTSFFWKWVSCVGLCVNNTQRRCHRYMGIFWNYGLQRPAKKRLKGFCMIFRSRRILNILFCSFVCSPFQAEACLKGVKVFKYWNKSFDWHFMQFKFKW